MESGLEKGWLEDLPSVGLIGPGTDIGADSDGTDVGAGDRVTGL